jgi:SET domain-containing protein
MTDYELFEHQLYLKTGWSPSDISIMVKNEQDMMNMPKEYRILYHLRTSDIHGLGIFAKKDFKKDTILFPARLERFRTDCGRWINHDPNPNCEFVKDNNEDLWVKTLVDIPKHTEFTLNYRQCALVNLGLILE